MPVCSIAASYPDLGYRRAGNYLFTERTPLRDEVLDMQLAKPKLLESKPIAERITAKMLSFVETFISGIGARL